VNLKIEKINNNVTGNNQTLFINIVPSASLPTVWTDSGALSYLCLNNFYNGVLYTTVINVYSTTTYYVIAGLYSNNTIDVKVNDGINILSLTRIA
jgi:hypothetical protein